MTTIKDVALAAGVSTATVSMVVNHKAQRLSQETIDHVLNVCAELKYRPNRIARSMVTKKTNIIGLLVPDLANPFFSSLVQMLNQEAQKMGYSIVINDYSSSNEKLLNLLNIFSGYQIDGLILTKSNKLNQEEEKYIMEYMTNSKIPYITLDSNLKDPRTHSIQVNHEHGGYIATEYLLNNNHKTIGVYTGPKISTSSSERIEGYAKALREHDLNFDSSLLFEGTYGFGNEDQALEHFLNLNCTAIFALNDVMAVGLSNAAKKRNIRIPEDLSIMGFDNAYLSEIVHPQLTTINQPIDIIAQDSLVLLKSLIETDDEINIKKNSKHIMPNLIIRGSVRKI